MPVIRWRGGAPAVAQVSAGEVATVGATPSGNTFRVSVGAVSVEQVGITNPTVTASGLVTALNASTHPYLSVITWSRPTGGTIRGTADVAGVEFVASIAVTGAASGTVTPFADTTPVEGPAVFDTAENWDLGRVPTTGDLITFANSQNPCRYRLGQGSLAATVEAHQSMQGQIGLEAGLFSTSADGSTTTAIADYRTSYLTLDASRVEVGRQLGVGDQVGSAMLKLSTTATGAPELVVLDTARRGQNGLPAVRLLAAATGATLEVRHAPGGVGLAAEAGDTSQVASVDVTDPDDASQVIVGPGATVGAWESRSGRHRLTSSGTMSLVRNRAGRLEVYGDGFTITAMDARGGTIVDTHTPTGGNAVGTLTAGGGEVDFTRSSEARTVNSLVLAGGAVLADTGVMTFTGISTVTGLVRISSEER